MRKVGLVSLGCAKNRVDSENMLGMLRERGYEIVNDPAEADVLFVNTCGFIEPAKEESIDAIFEMAQYKKQGRGKRLYVTGCLAQRYPEALMSEIPEIDGILGVADYARLFDMMEAAEAGQRPCYTANGARFLNTPRVLTTPGYSAYVKISDGCDNRCTYCAIPLIRGGYSSRPFDDYSLLTCLPTEYTLAQGAWADDETSTCWWWLRSPGNYYNCAAGIDWDGAIDSKGVSVTYSRGSIRPAIWINAGS